MKKKKRCNQFLLLAGALTMLTHSLCAQNVVIGCEESKELRFGTINHLSIAAENYNCKQLLVTVDSGIITALNDCQYTLVPFKMPVLTITVRERTTGKELRHESIRVSHQRNLSAGPCGANSKRLHLIFLRGCSSMEGMILNMDFEPDVLIRSFAVTVIRKEGTCQNLEQPEGHAFTDAMKGAFNTLQPGDKLLFHDLRGVHRSGAKALLAPSEYEIQ